MNKREEMLAKALALEAAVLVPISRIITSRSHIFVVHLFVGPTKMTNPSSATMEEDPLQRLNFRQFVPQHKRFINQNREYTQQFSHLYYTRLAEIQQELGSVCLKKWGDAGIKTVNRILDIQPGVPCVCVGTLYKEMALKPNFLVDYLQNVAGGGGGDEDDDDDDAGEAAADREAMVDAQRVTYQSEGDQLILEDESGRMTLEGAALDPHLMTGVVIGVKGVWQRDANFVVEDTCVCGFPVQKVSIKSCVRPDTGPVYLALISGLNVGSPKLKPLALQLMLDFVSGNIGDPDTAARIARLVVWPLLDPELCARSGGARMDCCVKPAAPIGLSPLALSLDPFPPFPT